MNDQRLGGRMSFPRSLDGKSEGLCHRQPVFRWHPRRLTFVPAPSRSGADTHQTEFPARRSKPRPAHAPVAIRRVAPPIPRRHAGPCRSYLGIGKVSSLDVLQAQHRDYVPLGRAGRDCMRPSWKYSPTRMIFDMISAFSRAVPYAKWLTWNLCRSSVL
jgi:hypothetical protein